MLTPGAYEATIGLDAAVRRELPVVVVRSTRVTT